jgi:hypothetical protein
MVTLGVVRAEDGQMHRSLFHIIKRLQLELFVQQSQVISQIMTKRSQKQDIYC